MSTAGRHKQNVAVAGECSCRTLIIGSNDAKFHYFFLIQKHQFPIHSIGIQILIFISINQKGIKITYSIQYWNVHLIGVEN